MPICFRAWLMVLIVAGAIASVPASAQQTPTRANGKAWGEECMGSSLPRQSAPGNSLTKMKECCEQKAGRDFPGCKAAGVDSPPCKEAFGVCSRLVTCDYRLDQCKLDAMETDKDCSTDKCKKCTSDYKSCHDDAL
jgi:hypothetical protein